MNALSRCVELAGGPVALTRELNKRLPRPVTYQAVMKWVRQGRLPRTEWTGETAYAAALSAAVDGQVSRDALLVRVAAGGHGGPLANGAVAEVRDAAQYAGLQSAGTQR